MMETSDSCGMGTPAAVWSVGWRTHCPRADWGGGGSGTRSG